MSRDAQQPTTDIAIVGAGLAGVAAAVVLGRARPVALIDPRPTCPPVFKAEKLEPDQIAILARLGLLGLLMPHAGRIRHVDHASGDRVFRHRTVEQYGLRYDTMVNGLAAGLDGAVQRCRTRAVGIDAGPDEQHVHLANGQTLRCRLVIVATGTGGNALLGPLGFDREVLQRDQSVALGFAVEPVGGERFPFDALTYFPSRDRRRIDYLSLFAFRDEMRANLFAFCSASEAWVRAFLRSPQEQLSSIFPALHRVTGPYRVRGLVEMARVSLLRTRGEPCAGVVLIGEASQTACPSTGYGVSKILTDVDLLSSIYVPRWFATPGMSAAKIAEFVHDARKRRTDAASLDSASYQRRLSMDDSLRWGLRRWRSHIGRHGMRRLNSLGRREPCDTAGEC